MMIAQSNDPTVYVSGSFDDLRTIDIRFLQEASRLGRVHALLFSDTSAQNLHQQTLKYPAAERLYFLENIRFIDQVSVVETDSTDLLPIDHHGDNGDQVTWAVRESDANARKSAFCAARGINLAPIPDTALAGFPIAEIPADRSNKKVMVSGCFDWVHSGHVRFFEEAASFGDLYVVVGHDENLRLLKGAHHPMFSQEERRYWVHAIRFVHRAVISSGHGWLDAEPEVLTYHPDMFIVNHDGDKPEKRRFFKEIGVEYRVLERRPKKGLKARESTHLRGF
jgi:cytidyltransferase-like protein